ncbi:MAG: LysM peptidoglycan-binding domain-containing protein [Eubacterium sp.]|nr:LysM peptidoglycan-binding domain-containing protein [Eubacterium sp.]
MQTYTVKPKDTLTQIAAAYHVSVSRLAAKNKITDPNLIYPGEVIRIP